MADQPFRITVVLEVNPDLTDAEIRGVIGGYLEDLEHQALTAARFARREGRTPTNDEATDNDPALPAMGEVRFFTDPGQRNSAGPWLAIG